MKLESEIASGIGKAARVMGSGFLIFLVLMFLLTKLMTDPAAAITSIALTLAILLIAYMPRRRH